MRRVCEVVCDGEVCVCRSERKGCVFVHKDTVCERENVGMRVSCARRAKRRD